MMTDQELIQRLQTLRNIKPSQDWVKRTEKDLKAVIPKSQWPIYSVIFCLALGLSLLGVIHELPVQESSDKSIKIIQEQKEEQKTLTQAQAKEQAKATVQKAKTVAKKIQAHLEEKIMASKIAPGPEDQVDARIKLLEDLDKVKAAGGILGEIEKDIENNDYLIARQKLNKYLDSLKVDSEKEEIIINQDNN